MVLLEEQRDLAGLLEDLHAAAGPRLRRSAAYAQLEVTEALRRAAHVLGVVQPLGTRLRGVRQLPVRRIDDPLRRARVRHVLRRLRLHDPTLRTGGDQSLPEPLGLRQHAEGLQLAVGRVGLVHTAAGSHPGASDIRRPVGQPLDGGGSLRHVLDLRRRFRRAGRLTCGQQCTGGRDKGRADDNDVLLHV